VSKENVSESDAISCELDANRRIGATNPTESAVNLGESTTNRSLPGTNLLLSAANPALVTANLKSLPQLTAAAADLVLSRRANAQEPPMTDTSTEPQKAPAVTHDFEAEVGQVLHLVIHSLYSHKEVFLRELISNASDALDKLRFRAVTEPALLEKEPALEIRILPDREKQTLTIEDTGIGMTEEELTRELGTVARSGSKAFLEKLADRKKDVNLIGQFGVGFYSAYLVADRVDVVSRAAGADKAYRWSSDGKKSFSVVEVPLSDHPGRGSSVTLHLKEDQKEFLEPWRVRELVSRYSDYVSQPIKLRDEKAKKEGEDAPADGGFETINRASALWQRPKAEITEEQYDEFYKHLAHDHEKPLAHVHFKVEGTQEFTGLVFVPRSPPFDMGFTREARGVRLFVKRVLIMDRCEELLPEWLRFVRGVVDSDDLPLNVSREVLQDSQASRIIKKQLVKSTLDLLDSLAADKPDDYAVFWQSFGVMVKEGLAVDFEYRERLGKLVRYASSHVPAADKETPADKEKPQALTSLHDYVARMKEGQEAIYYVLGESLRSIESSPHLEELRRRGFEVLYMTDPVDEWAAEGLREFEGKKLVSAMRAELKLDETPEQKKAKEEQGAELAPLLARMKEVLGDKVVDVRLSDRLTDSPACLVLQGAGPHGYVDRLLRERGKDVPKAKRVLELNAAHPIITHLLGALGKDAAKEKVSDWVTLLYEQALLTEGSALEDPNRFARLVTSLLSDAAAAAG
jgi:molecular chaperone HtpG